MLTNLFKETAHEAVFQRVDKPSHSVSVLRAGAHESQIRSAPVLVLPRLQGLSITLKRRQRAKMKIILALCQQSERLLMKQSLFSYIIRATGVDLYYSSLPV
ncbi:MULTISPECIES: hypothetical protein [Bacillus]|uniref:hypothetical protein n=1 Tax=Bacillus TaxID=1386 RepID=UPI001E34C1D8|nr:hypothetical protein [Bacillus pumilus]MCC9089025.1 hypothetical protein [Bacillus pumilus]UUD43568.1 hypothetical protein NPA43_04680 [Bacillus pumilus]